jgi:hypothetical protein
MYVKNKFRGIMLIEMSQIEKDKYYISFICPMQNIKLARHWCFMPIILRL